jgi:broad-specificity NMP kinase
MIIELIGPPGAGKTFLAKEIRDQLRHIGFDAMLSTEAEISLGMGFRPLAYLVIAVYAALFFVLYPKLVLRVISRQFSRPSPIRQSIWLIRSFLQTGARYLAFSRSSRLNKKVIIFDGGLAHFSVSMFTSEFEAPARDEISQYVKNILQPDLIIVVKSSLNTCLRRLEKRELPRRIAGKDPKTIRAFVKNQLATVQLVSSIERKMKKNVVSVSNQSTREAASREISRLLTKIKIPSHVQVERFLNTVVKADLAYSKGNLNFHLRELFSGVDFEGKDFLDIGAGAGIYCFYAVVKGANIAIGLEPMLDGSAFERKAKFKTLRKHLIFPGVNLYAKTFQNYRVTKKFDVVTLYNSVNHLNEEACATLGEKESSRIAYLQIFRKLFSLCSPGANLILCDSSSSNLSSLLKIRHPLFPAIEWQKHQKPDTWKDLLLEVGFVEPKLRWTTMNSLRTIGKALMGNRLVSYLMASHFCLSVKKPG